MNADQEVKAPLWERPEFIKSIRSSSLFMMLEQMLDNPAAFNDPIKTYEAGFIRGAQYAVERLLEQGETMAQQIEATNPGVMENLKTSIHEQQETAQV
jgi:hypothetical protein